MTVVEPEAFTPRRSADAGRGGTLIPEEIPPVCVLLRTGERMTGRCGLTRIGRGGMCDIRISEDTVSSLHLEVYSFSDADGCTITDQSSNGTLVNGRRVARYSTAALKDGDEIVMGTHRYLFRAIVMRACAGTPAAAQPPEAY